MPFANRGKLLQMLEMPWNKEYLINNSQCTRINGLLIMFIVQEDTDNITSKHEFPKVAKVTDKSQKDKGKVVNFNYLRTGSI